MVEIKMFPTPLQIISFLTIFFLIFIFVLFLLKNKKVFGRSLKEYTWKTKFYFLGAAVAVYLQYLAMSFPLSARIGQLLWELMIALSVITLVKKYKFNLKNIAFLGILFALWIHGAKVCLRYFIYGNYEEIYRTFRYISGRFIYGSVLAVVIAIGTFLILSLIEETNKKQKNKKKIMKILVGLILVVIILLVAVMFYGKFG